MNHTLDKYIAQFRAMNCNKQRGVVAPHKVIMLLAVMEGISYGHITSSLIPHSDLMVNAFKRVWNHYVQDSVVFKPTFTTPYIHLSSEPFWELVKTDDFVFSKEYSIGKLRQSFYGAKIPDDLFELMQNPSGRNSMTRTLIGLLNQNIIKHTSLSMSYFDNILKARNLTECPLPLWKLKITDKEYETLKELLMQHAIMYRTFISVRKEAALFFAEYWRREYYEGSHSKEMVFAAISSKTDKRLQDDFYEAAKIGARQLGIERYEGGREQNLNSMLYQGGLPMRLVTTTDVNSVWGRFVKGLVFRNINFDELNLGIVASTNKGLRQYCAQLCDAVDSKDFTKMPCWCETELNPWYQFLLNKFTTIRRKHRLENPFSLDWEFIFDKVDNKVHIKYDFKGLQRLPKVFCEENRLKIERLLTLNITRNGHSVDSFDYLEGFCRHEVRSKHPYNNGDVIAASLQGIDSPLRKESFDHTIPHLLASIEKGTYKPCNRIGCDESVILVPENWVIVSGADELQITKMEWIDIPIKCIWIPENFSSEIIIVSEDGKLTFGADTELSWTEVTSLPLFYPNVVEPLYDAADISCALYTQNEDVPVKKMSRGVEFRNKWSDTWTNMPSYGEIFVRAKSNDGEFVSHEKIINIGDQLIVQTVDADRTHCKIRIDWPHGYVAGPEGAVVKDNEWIIERDTESGVDRHHIEFSFTPFQNDRNRFVLHVKAPFKDFSISDGDGNKIKNNCLIPFSDIEKYSYYIVGIDVRKLRVGDKEFRLSWSEDSLYISSDVNGRILIPYEGSLTRILGNRESLMSMLEKTSEDMLHAIIPVSFDLSNGSTFAFTIKEAPYHIKQDNDTIYVTENDWSHIYYKHALKLLRLDDPSVEPVTIKSNDEGCFTIPEEVKSWGNTLVIGRNRGRICPALVNTEIELSIEDRHANRYETTARICEELKTSNIGSPIWERVTGWFDRCNKEDIPASSLLDLSCLKKDPKYLLKFALVMFAETPEEERENLDDRLMEMAKDLGFQWYWLLPFIHNGLAAIMQSFVSDDTWTSRVITRLYINRLSEKEPDRLFEHLQNMGAGNDQFVSTLINQCLTPMMGELYNWLVNLCKKSMMRPFCNTDIDTNSKTIINDIVDKNALVEIHSINDEDFFISQNQNLDEVSESFFAGFTISGNKSKNELWLLQRVKCVAEQIRGNLNLFDQHGPIRRSVIFCYRSMTQRFLIELNNELAKK